MSTTTATPRSPFRFHPKLWVAAALLLALPAAAMLVTDEVDWSADDFAAFAVMLAAGCAVLEVAMNRLTALRWRIGAATLAVLLLLTLWAHLAVDLIR